MKSIIKSLLSRTPYRISGSGASNRFDAISDVLSGLRTRGFDPSRIIDGGANVGAFALKAHGLFPRAAIEMVEPQPACHAILGELARRKGFTLHPVALVSPATAGKPVSLTTPIGEVSTGAHIQTKAGEAGVSVQTDTLDHLMQGKLGAKERLFLKLDLQGYELEAMMGGAGTLIHTEVILTEVSFFAQAYEPPIAKLIAWLDHRCFTLYDIAAVNQRARDGRARQGDFVFVRRDSALAADTLWA